MGEGNTSMTIAEQIAVMEGSLKAAIRLNTQGTIAGDWDTVLSAYGRAEYVYGATTILLGVAEGDDKERAMLLVNQASSVKSNILDALRHGRRR